MDRNKVIEYKEAAQAVYDAIEKWGSQCSGYLYMKKDPWKKFYSPAVDAGMWKVRDIAESCVKFMEDQLEEDERTKFNRMEARYRVMESHDHPGMFCAYIDGQVCWYATVDHALDALEAVFNGRNKA